MSGPIVRKYGFPNFEKIFGDRPLEHGSEEGNVPQETTKAPDTKAAKKSEKKAPKANGKKKS